MLETSDLLPRLGHAARRQTLRALARLRRWTRAAEIGRPLAQVTWPRAAWTAVLLLIAAYLVLDREAAEPTMVEMADLDCLALNIYFEARGESLSGKRAVGHVVMNRVADETFPDTVCEVVRQGGEEQRDKCQFSWWCDGRSDRPLDQVAWRESREIAWEVLRGVTGDPTGGALWYHADYVLPSWSESKVKDRQIGQHVFYLRP
jgi:hypothetical protein